MTVIMFCVCTRRVCASKIDHRRRVLYLSQHYKPNFHAKNIIWLKFTINYSLFKLNYNWRHCSVISLTVFMLCVCTKRVCVRFTDLVCKAVWLAFSCQTSAISFSFIPIPCIYFYWNYGDIRFLLVGIKRVLVYNSTIF